MRGRSKIKKKLMRKQKNIVDDGVVKLREAREKEKADKQREGGDGDQQSTQKDSAPPALRRFF